MIHDRSRSLGNSVCARPLSDARGPVARRTLLLLSVIFLCAASAFAEGELPEGAGKQVIQQHCAGCHAGAALAGYQKTREDWDAIVFRMGQRTAASRDDLTTLVDYLATNFPKVDDPNKVNVNKADAKEIAERLGLPLKEAEAIVNYRERRGTFRTWGDLLVIYGVDGSKIEAVQDKLSF
jgi:competence ComEA-like helix-hairpin-helix protein